MRRQVAGLAGLTLALALAAPAAALTSERFAFDDVLVNVYSCGVVETTHVHGDGTSWFAADGSWQSDTIHFRYAGRFEDPATGTVIEQKGRQTLTIDAVDIASRGQGVFLRLGGEGVVLHDVGRLVFDPGDGSTLHATPKVIPFDDPESAARIDAAVCSMFD